MLDPKGLVSKVCLSNCTLFSDKSNFVKCSCKAVFINTDPMSAKESRVGDLVQNEWEALLIQQVNYGCA
jgi:hypothetical protein